MVDRTVDQVKEETTRYKVLQQLVGQTAKGFPKENLAMLFSRRRRTRATADSDMKKFFIFLDSSKKPNLVQESFYSDMWRWLSTLPEFLLSSSFANIVASYFLASSSAMWCHWSIQQ